MTQRLPRTILLAAVLALQGFGPARAAPPKHAPLPPVRPAFPDDPPLPPDDPNAPQASAEGQSQQAAYQQGAASQYAANPPASFGPFGALFAPAPQPAPPPPPPEAMQAVAPQPAPTPRPSPVESASVQPVTSGPADYPSAQVNLRRDRDEEVEGFAIAEKAGLADMTRKYARQHGVPLALLHRVIMRESKYCPRLINRRYFGLMQITPATARSMGYKGGPKGLLDPETNLAYAVPYLANAWALADGDMDRAVRLYAAGYYYTAKNKGMLSQMRDAHSPPVRPTVASLADTAPPPPPQPTNIFQAMFGTPNR
ncbi:transglycosylase SLT domain-containing protein [Rhodoblastus sp.]|uniref:transglycosylase SLT domain-containing protein n=1 Tax=Rhodoblastus sp. TaxID=1962975 RepID=UPI0035B13609